MFGNQKKANEKKRAEETCEELEHLFKAISTDPRYIRSIRKYAPDFFSVRTMKNIIDPQNIPIYGTVVCIYNAIKTKKKEKILSKMDQEDNEELPMITLKGGMQAHVIRETTKAAVSVMFLFIPLHTLAIFTFPVGLVAEVAIEGGAKYGCYKTAELSARTAVAQEGTEGDDIHKKYKTTRALLKYLGYPKSDDPIYETWEDSRLQIKRIFGATDEENLYDMKPSKELEKAIKKQEKEGNGYKPNELPEPVSLLLLLFRIYDCWDEPFFDHFEKVPQKVKKATYIDKKASLEKKGRLWDEKYVRRIVNPLDANVVLLTKERANEAEELMYNSLLRSNELTFCLKGTTDKTTKKDEIEPLKIIVHSFVNYFIKKEELYGYLSGTENILSACCIFQSSDQNSLIFVDKIPTLKYNKILTKYLGKFIIHAGISELVHIRKQFEIQESLAKKAHSNNTDNNGKCSCVRLLSGDKHDAKKLIKSLTKSENIQTVAIICHDDNDDSSNARPARKYYEKVGFSVHSDTKLQSNNHSIKLAYLQP